MIGVPEMVSDIADPPPWNFGLGRLKFIGNVTGCFAENLNEALKGGTQDTIAKHIVKRLAFEKQVNLIDCIDNIAQPKSRSILH